MFCKTYFRNFNKFLRLTDLQNNFFSSNAEKDS